ncbi:hypothetical protein GCM10023222_58020 [Saccharopolyspora cebuensis]
MPETRTVSSSERSVNGEKIGRSGSVRGNSVAATLVAQYTIERVLAETGQSDGPGAWPRLRP